MVRSRYIPVALFAFSIIAVQLLTALTDRTQFLTQLTMTGYYSLVIIGLCLLIGYAGQISLGHAGFFAIGGYASAFLTTYDKADIDARLNALIAANHPAVPRWISDDELAGTPELVRTMSVKPPSGQGRVRLLDIGPGTGAPGSIDLQPCGGTHVRATGEIGRVTVEKIENKGKRNRRVVVALAG